MSSEKDTPQIIVLGTHDKSGLFLQHLRALMEKDDINIAIVSMEESEEVTGRELDAIFMDEAGDIPLVALGREFGEDSPASADLFKPKQITYGPQHNTGKGKRRRW